MIWNNLRISLRYLFRNKAFTGINLLGLTLGFLSFIVVALYVHDELNYDSAHKGADLIFRVIQHEQLDDGTLRSVAQVAAQIGPVAMSEFPEIEDAIRISVWGRITMGNDPEKRHYQRLMPTDPGFLTMFNFPLEQGDAATALKEPLSVVMTQETAQKYFGNEPAIGKQVWTNLVAHGNPVHLQVTGVLKALPSNTHLRIDMLISEPTFKSIFSWYGEYETTDWTSNDNVTYLRLRGGSDVKATERKLTEMVRSHYPADRKFRSTFSLQPVRDIHLSSGYVQERTEISATVTKPFYIYSFAFVGVLLLLIACLNYVNLSTAAAYQRTREIGARKTLGAQRSQLLAQFSGEALLISVTALVLAVFCTWLLLPTINVLIEKQLTLLSLPLKWTLVLVATMLFAGLLSSMYPAFVITRVKPVEALKKVLNVGRQGLLVRKLIVSSQLAISILMIAATMVVYQQLNFMKDKDLGFKLDNLLIIDINSRSMRDLEAVKSELISLPEVQSVAASSRVPGEWKTFPIASVRNFGSPETTDMVYVGIDGDFLQTYEMKLVEGRNITSDPSDSLKVMLTTLAVEQLGLTNPVGQMIEIPKYRFGAEVENATVPLRMEVVGVLENFHFESFRQKMMPVIFGYYDSEIQTIDYYTLRVQTKDWSKTIEKLGDVYKKIESVSPLEYNFLNERFADFYREDEKRGNIFLVFSAEIILIACLGLFALVSFSVQRRTREISIRKTLGASVSNIVLVLARDFIGITAIALIVALPLSWYLANKWLQDFAYRIDLGPGIFLAAAVVSVLITSATVSFKTIYAASTNPVKWLRSE
jgi:putative ABC transport system permease protein